MTNKLLIHKNGATEIRVPRISVSLRESVNRCAKAERKSQRDFCIDALQQAVNDSPLRLGIQRIDRRLREGVPSRPDEIGPRTNDAAAIVADETRRHEREEGGAA